MAGTASHSALPTNSTPSVFLQMAGYEAAAVAGREGQRNVGEEGQRNVGEEGEEGAGREGEGGAGQEGEGGAGQEGEGGGQQAAPEYSWDKVVIIDVKAPVGEEAHERTNEHPVDKGSVAAVICEIEEMLEVR